MAKFARNTASAEKPRERAARLPSLAGAARTFSNHEIRPRARRPRPEAETAAPVCAGLRRALPPKAIRTTSSATECIRIAGTAKSPWRRLLSVRL